MKYSFESMTEAAQCIWEHALDLIHEDGTVFKTLRGKLGTAELRGQLRDTELLTACLDGWEIVEKNEELAHLALFDWDYVPLFVERCLDWCPITGSVAPCANWKDILFNEVK